MRQLCDHKIDSFNKDHVMIEVEDPIMTTSTFPTKYNILLRGLGGEYQKFNSVKFQDGVTVENTPAGVVQRAPNGVSDAALVAIVIDRLKADASQTEVARNHAMTHLLEALFWLRRDAENKNL